MSQLDGQRLEDLVGIFSEGQLDSMVKVRVSPKGQTGLYPLPLPQSKYFYKKVFPGLRLHCPHWAAHWGRAQITITTIIINLLLNFLLTVLNLKLRIISVICHWTMSPVK